MELHTEGDDLHSRRWNPVFGLAGNQTRGGCRGCVGVRPSRLMQATRRNSFREIAKQLHCRHPLGHAVVAAHLEIWRQSRGFDGIRRNAVAQNQLRPVGTCVSVKSVTLTRRFTAQKLTLKLAKLALKLAKVLAYNRLVRVRMLPC
jgi:hypothetical protein